MKKKDELIYYIETLSNHNNKYISFGDMKFKTKPSLFEFLKTSHSNTLLLYTIDDNMKTILCGPRYYKHGKLQIDLYLNQVQCKDCGTSENIIVPTFKRKKMDSIDIIGTLDNIPSNIKNHTCKF